MYKFDSSVEKFSSGSDLSRLMVHRVNLADETGCTDELKGLVGSKSGIAVINSSEKKILLPPGSSVEVDFFVAEDRVVLTHGNLWFSKLEQYPTLEQYLGAWQVKREAEVALGVRPGLILANVKSHGGEEKLLVDRCIALGVPADEIVLLDQEIPATDRILREKRYGDIAPLALRISRAESMESVLMVLQQPSIFGQPRAVFLDPGGEELEATVWPVSEDNIAAMYSAAPSMEFILCCPSRWGKKDRIPDVAERLHSAGVKKPIVMTDIDLFPQWQEILNKW